MMKKELQYGFIALLIVLLNSIMVENFAEDYARSNRSRRKQDEQCCVMQSSNSEYTSFTNFRLILSSEMSTSYPSQVPTIKITKLLATYFCFYHYNKNTHFDKPVYHPQMNRYNTLQHYIYEFQKIVI